MMVDMGCVREEVLKNFMGMTLEAQHECIDLIEEETKGVEVMAEVPKFWMLLGFVKGYYSKGKNN